MSKTKYLKRTSDRGPNLKTRQKQNRIKEQVQIAKKRERFFLELDAKKHKPKPSEEIKLNES